jgi:membrane protease YdiL (CAAX protease family)
MLANGDDRPIWLTEFSWSSLQVGEASQAAYLQRSYELLASWSFVPVGIWSSVIDSGFTSTRPFIDWAAAIPQVLVFVLFVAVVQELLFRGVLQAAALRALGRAGLVLVSLVFALLHLSLQAPALVPLMFVVGLGFAHLVVRTRSLYGVTLAYAVTYVTAFLVLPSVLRYGGL